MRRRRRGFGSGTPTHEREGHRSLLWAQSSLQSAEANAAGGNYGTAIDRAMEVVIQGSRASAEYNAAGRFQLATDAADLASQAKHLVFRLWQRCGCRKGA